MDYDVIYRVSLWALGDEYRRKGNGERENRRVDGISVGHVLLCYTAWRFI